MTRSSTCSPNSSRARRHRTPAASGRRREQACLRLSIIRSVESSSLRRRGERSFGTAGAQPRRARSPPRLALLRGPRAYFSTREDLLSAAFDHIQLQTSSRTIRATEGQHGMAALRSCCLEILPLDATSRDEAVWSSRSGRKHSPTPASPNATNGPRVSGEQRSSTSSPGPAKQARSIPTCATSRSSVTFSPLSSGRRSPRRSCRVVRQHRRRSPNSTAISTHSTPTLNLSGGMAVHAANLCGRVTVMR
jgi:hypothetical protein